MNGCVMPMNPWRKGRKAAQEYYDARAAWLALPSTDRGPAPQTPVNPYPTPPWQQRVSKNNGHLQWAEGLKSGVRDAEAKARCGGKKPSWSFEQ